MDRVSNFSLLGLSFVFALFSGPIYAEPSDKNIVSRTAEIDGVQLHYLAAGHGSTVILLHGYTQTSRTWKPIIPRVEARVLTQNRPSGLGPLVRPRTNATIQGYQESTNVITKNAINLCCFRKAFMLLAVIKLSRTSPFGRGTRCVLVGMSDPRNVAHAKKVTQEKHHQEAKPAAKLRKGKKPPEAPQSQPAETASTPANTEVAKAERQPGDLEASLTVLSKLKDLEFHSRANIETLAQLSLTVEEELKQREFSEAIGGLYSAQEAFHSKIAAFIETYQVKCESLKQPA